MLRLYWNKSYLATPARVKDEANFFDCNPLSFEVGDAPFLYIHPQANGRVLDRYIGHSEKCNIIITEDEMSRPMTYNGSTIYGIELIKSWERSAYRWLQHERVNSGEILQVSHVEVPEWSHPDEIDVFNEVLYQVVGQVFHLSNAIS